MGDDYPIHDAAWAATAAVVDLFHLRPEERVEAFPLVYERVKDAIQAYATAKARERRRLFGRPPRSGEGRA